MNAHPCACGFSFGKPNYVLATEGLPENVETWDTSQVVKWAKNLGNGNRTHVLAARYTPSPPRLKTFWWLGFS